MHDTVNIECKTHGVFSQIARNHAKGSNCPTCVKEAKQFGARYNRLGRNAVVYYVYFPTINLYKIGVTVDQATRFNGEIHEHIVLWCKDYPSEALAYYVEHLLLKENTTGRYQGPPLLKRGGNTELLTTDILKSLAVSVETIESTSEFTALMEVSRVGVK